MPAFATQSTTGRGSQSSAIPSARPSTPPFAGAATAMPAPSARSRTACSRSPAPCSEPKPATGLHARRRKMRPDLFSRRGPARRSTAACAPRLGAPATVPGQLAHDRLVVVSIHLASGRPFFAKQPASQRPFATLPLRCPFLPGSIIRERSPPGWASGRPDRSTRAAAAPSTFGPAAPGRWRGRGASASRPSGRPSTACPVPRAPRTCA